MPQMPALLFCFARSARFGPLFAFAFFVCTPALLLAVLQRLLNASAPAPAPAAAGLGCDDAVGLPRFAAENADVVDEARGWGVRDEKAEEAPGEVTEAPVLFATGTEVK